MVIKTLAIQTMPEAVIIELAIKYLGRDFPEIAWTTGTAILLLSPITIIGNGLVLASIFFDPFKNIRSSPCSNLMFSLALADLLVGVLTGPLVAYWHIYTAITNSQPFLYKGYIIHPWHCSGCVTLQSCRSIGRQANSHHYSSTVRSQSDEKANTDCKRVYLVLRYDYSNTCVI